MTNVQAVTCNPFMQHFKVTFYPDNKTVEVEQDKTILSAALSAGVYLTAACGGDGVCGRCKVIVKKGSVLTQPSPALTLAEKKGNIFLACLTTVHGDLEVEVPASSRTEFEHLSQEELAYRLTGMYSDTEDVEAAGGALQQQFAHAPRTQKKYVELSAPTLDDQTSDLERLYAALGEQSLSPDTLQTSLTQIRPLGELLREANWKVTVTVGARDGMHELLLVEPGDTRLKHYGLCFDIGTTTISGQLVDLDSRAVLGTKAAYNKQASFGSDVITRIMHARRQDGLEQLHDAVIDTMNQIIRELAKEHAVDVNNISSVVCAGNTTMMHLLLSIDPAYIRREPYVPTANILPVLRAAESDIRINPRGLLSCVPGVASYVGGDITAGVLSSGLYRQTELSLLIDIGTNGEVVLGNKDFMVGCAASAGPAFEGSGVSCGMRASSGAIQKVRIGEDARVAYETIAGAPARGICGSGYIAALTQLLDRGIIDKSGKIISDVGPRVREGEAGKEFLLAGKGEAGALLDIVITEADIENLKRAKGAIYAAVSVLVKFMGMEMPAIKKFFIAGGFGTYLDIESSVRIGLLPDLERSRFEFIGNSSLAGARQVLLSMQAGGVASEIAKKITYCELSAHPGYMDEYMAALFFPHTDIERFPSIKKSG
jgi:uncharacterized 2Fe-2S/4Fe-4S cluster protein (DUF4445 family)